MTKTTLQRQGRIVVGTGPTVLWRIMRGDLHIGNAYENKARGLFEYGGFRGSKARLLAHLNPVKA
jgi:hypothetical protein